MRTETTLPARLVQPRTCIIVAGMHRSGTSATARVINLLGAAIASDLIPSIPGNNERGFWESATTFNLHDRLLTGLDSAWDDPYPLSDDWLETNAAREAKREILEHVDKEFADSKMFVVKDPRLTRLLPLWLETLDQLAIAPIVVIPFRNPLEVAASLEQRDGLSLAKSILGYIQGNLEVERASRGRVRVFHLYDELISDWRAFADKLASAGGPNKATLTAKNAAQIDSFLTGDLQHHRATRDSLASLPDAAATLAEMYDQMVQVAATGDETSLRACFDRLRERTGEAAKLFRSVAAATAKDYREEVARLDSKMAAEFQRRDAELEQLRSQLRQRDASVEEMAVELRRRDARVEEMGAELRRRDARVEEMAAELRQRDARIEEMTGELRQRGVELNDLRAQVNMLEARVTEAMRKHVLASEELAGMVRSTSWRVTAPLRAVGRLKRALYRRGGNFKAW